MAGGSGNRTPGVFKPWDSMPAPHRLVMLPNHTWRAKPGLTGCATQLGRNRLVSIQRRLFVGEGAGGGVCICLLGGLAPRHTSCYSLVPIPLSEVGIEPRRPGSQPPVLKPLDPAPFSESGLGQKSGRVGE